MSSTRRAIPVTCTTHSSGTNFCNLLMTRETDGTNVFDPHVDECCLLRLDERAATAVFGDGRAPTLPTRRETFVVGVPAQVCQTALVAHHTVRTCVMKSSVMSTSATISRGVIIAERAG